MNELIDALAKDLFKSPAFREQLQLWFTEAVRGCEWIDAVDAERIMKNLIRDCTVSIDVD